MPWWIGCLPNSACKLLISAISASCLFLLHPFAGCDYAKIQSVLAAGYTTSAKAELLLCEEADPRTLILKQQLLVQEGNMDQAMHVYLDMVKDVVASHRYLEETFPRIPDAVSLWDYLLLLLLPPLSVLAIYSGYRGKPVLLSLVSLVLVNVGFKVHSRHQALESWQVLRPKSSVRLMAQTDSVVLAQTDSPLYARVLSRQNDWIEIEIPELNLQGFILDSSLL